MNSELFNRLKKIAQNEGRVVFIDRDEAFVLSALEEEYDDDFISDYNCGDDCSRVSFGTDGTEEIAVKDKFESGAEATETETDKELIKKVNEDIAKWRVEQEKQENIETPVVEQSSLRGAAKKHGSTKEEKADFVIASSSACPAKPKGRSGEDVEISLKDEKNDVLIEEERYYLEPLE